MADNQKDTRGRNRGGARRDGAKPLPISALPLPVDDDDAPPLSLPRNKDGELSPAQRARLGLDINPSVADAAAGRGSSAADDATSGFVAPIDDDLPKLAPVGGGRPGAVPRDNAPKLAGVGNPSPANHAAARRVEKLDGPGHDFGDSRAQRDPQKKQPSAGTFAAIKRDREVLTYGVGWTAFAVVVTAIMAFTNSIGNNPIAGSGPGPLITGLLSIALGWVVVIVARASGPNWWALILIPLLVLIGGPIVYRGYWASGVENSARSYLSSGGAHALIDIDASSIVSETINTPRGCFAINQNRTSGDTEVSVVTFQAETARQQADFGLAPRYARRIATGGTRALQRIFTFRDGRGPPSVAVSSLAPLDCAGAVSAPGTGADPRTDE